MNTVQPRAASHHGLLTDTPMPENPWIKATRSGDGGNCVELRGHAGAVEIRDSKDPDGPRLRLTGGGLGAWLRAARAGELDHLLP